MVAFRPSSMEKPHEKTTVYLVFLRSDRRRVSRLPWRQNSAPLPPAFSPAANPYKDGIYASGILESEQSSGQNINIYPEVSGTVREIPVREGQEVHKGDLLLQIDDSIQNATVEQLHSQSMAALSALEGLRAEPRKETLEVSEAQVVAAQAALKTAQDTYNKQKAAYDM